MYDMMPETRAFALDIPAFVTVIRGKKIYINIIIWVPSYNCGKLLY